MVELFNNDCLDILPQITENSVDLILCDLPYGITKNMWDSQIPLPELWVEYNRICKPKAPVILFGQNMFTVNVILSNPKDFRYLLVWDKVLSSGFLNANRQPLRSHEDIIVFYKSQPAYNPQKKKGAVNHNRGVSSIGKAASGENYGKSVMIQSDKSGEKFPNSILTFPKDHSTVTVHPTQKPVALIEYLIRTYTNDGDIVLDNCMGSGTTGVAALKNGRKFIGIEKDKKYFDIAEERIKEVLKNAV